MDKEVATTTEEPGTTGVRGNEEGEEDRMELALLSSHRDKPPQPEKNSNWKIRVKTSTILLLPRDLKIPTVVTVPT